MNKPRKPPFIATHPQRKQVLDSIAEAERAMLPFSVTVDADSPRAREDMVSIARQVTRADARSASPYRPTRRERLMDYLLATAIGVILVAIIMNSLT